MLQGTVLCQVTVKLANGELKSSTIELPVGEPLEEKDVSKAESLTPVDLENVR